MLLRLRKQVYLLSNFSLLSYAPLDCYFFIEIFFVEAMEVATESNQSRISLAKLNVILPTGITITVEANLSSSLMEFQVGYVYHT